MWQRKHQHPGVQAGNGAPGGELGSVGTRDSSQYSRATAELGRVQQRAQDAGGAELGLPARMGEGSGGSCDELRGEQRGGTGPFPVPGQREQTLTHKIPPKPFLTGRVGRHWQSDRTQSVHPQSPWGHSRDCSAWKRPLRSSSPATNPAAPPWCPQVPHPCVF